MQIFNNPNYNFIRWRWHAIIAVARSSSPASAMMATRGLPLGIDFSGGTLVVVQFEQPVTEEQVRDGRRRRSPATRSCSSTATRPTARS